MGQDRQRVPTNERSLPLLDQDALDALFASVYHPLPRNAPETERYLLAQPDQIRSWFELLMAHQAYNYVYRHSEYAKLLPTIEDVLGPFERNSEGTSFWLALCLALKEAYGMRTRTLASVMRLVRVRS